ncbi:hypothetical protein [Nocardioides rubriscoriae]|uniref:hypothetical protein n=1 Tax=Nocardioides rubriscoriae TaxID=642762 RepID=UPI0011E059D7|nr:hypothetical protein [Nocardioides rubriscoriae]
MNVPDPITESSRSLSAASVPGVGGMQDAPTAMPVADFTNEVIGLLAQEPTPSEILVERVRPLRHAVTDGTYAEMLAGSAGLLAMLPGH